MGLPADVGLIAGSGIEWWAPSGGVPIKVETPYGVIEAFRSEVSGIPFYLVRRHGEGHGVPPHKVNYRALIWGLQKLGVRRVLASAAVGAIRPGLGSGELVVVDDFIDFTHGRAASFYDHTPGVHHVDMTHPYCPTLSQSVWETVHPEGNGPSRPIVYAATHGPRFETPAEIRALAVLGADIVGMTQVPEASLAREAGLCYACLAVVTNPAAGLGAKTVDEKDVYQVLKEGADSFKRAFTRLLETLSERKECPVCGHESLPGAKDE